MKNTNTALVVALFLPFLLALSPGQQAPQISAKNQEGKLVSLEQYRGKHVLVYFYPKDDTPGCTREAQGFRDHYSKFLSLNVVILGVSRQDEKSHLAFKAKHQLPFDLLVDSDGSIAQAFEVGLMPILGFSKRQSILIGPDGKVLRFYSDVEPAEHAVQVIRDIEATAPKASGAKAYP